MTDAHVALLRGINLGSRRLPMKELVAMLEDAARRVPAILEKEISERFGFECPVVTRTAAEIDGTVKANPFPEAAAEPKTLHVGFLRDRPEKARSATGGRCSRCRR